MLRISMFLALLVFLVSAVSASTSSRRGIAVGPEGQIYLTDSDTYSVWRLDRAGRIQSKWGGEGAGKGTFEYPSGVAVDASGNVYISDSRLNVVQKFDASGCYIGGWDGKTSSGSERMKIPLSIAADAKGNVYVASAGAGSITVFSPTGKPLRVLGRQGTKKGQFLLPMSVGVDRSGNVYVGDFLRGDIQKLSASGAYISQWRCKVETADQVCSPNSLAVDASGNVFVLGNISNITFREPGHVKIYDKVGTVIQKFNPSGTLISKWIPVALAESLAVDSAGKVYTVGLQDNQLIVQIFDGNGKLISTMKVAR